MQTFTSSEFGRVRTIDIDGEPWFVAADVCEALDIRNPTNTIKKLDDDEKARLNLGLRGGDTNVVNESGLYGLVLGSRKPEAKAFKRWITHEVIPSIRKTGGYIAGQQHGAKVLPQPGDICAPFEPNLCVIYMREKPILFRQTEIKSLF